MSPIYMDVPGYAPVAPPSKLLEGVGAGPLLYLEPGSPIAPINAVPANGSTMLDLAERWTTLTLGAAPNPLTVANTSPAGSAKTKVARTARNGLHLMNSQQAQASPYELFDILLGENRLAYLNAHLDHTFYVSSWFRQTRAPREGSSIALPVAALRRTGTYATIDHYAASGVLNSAPWFLPQETAAQARGHSSLKDGDSFFVASASAAPYVTPFVMNGPLLRLLTWNAARLNNLPSIVVYRAFVEDLTVSGRSFEEAAAIDREEFVDQVLTVGGRYYGDTYESPAVVLP